jgi:hypothetical protein
MNAVTLLANRFLYLVRLTYPTSTIILSGYPNIVGKFWQGRLRQILMYSSKRLRNKYPYLKTLPTMWTKTYYVGNVSAEVIKRYIEECQG